MCAASAAIKQAVETLSDMSQLRNGVGKGIDLRGTAV